MRNHNFLHFRKLAFDRGNKGELVATTIKIVTGMFVFKLDVAQ